MVSIIIVNTNTRGLLKYCLRNLAANLPQTPIEVIIFDNGSHDGTAEMLEKEISRFKSIAQAAGRIIEVKVIYYGKNNGYAVGNNRAIAQAATGEYYLLYNTDIYLLPGSIDLMVEYLQQNPRVGVLAPQLLNPDRSRQHSIMRFPSLMMPSYRRTFLGKTIFGQRHLAEYQLNNLNLDKTQAIDWAISAAIMVRKAAWQAANGLDERFFVYLSDVDLSRKLWNLGWSTYYLPAAQMIHLHRRESADLIGFKSLKNRMTRIHIIDWFKYILKYRLTRWPTSDFYRQQQNKN
jgi:hypothetical protein